jgi:hypothetical protein
MFSSLPLAERDAVREQLERILASHFFRNSKRFPDFLRYTVEHALNGNTEDVKERTLGIEVFGRQPDYDTSLDPVVRVTAAEVRKRLAQYYQVPGHENETRIEYLLRSYVPEFTFSKPTPALVAVPIEPATASTAAGKYAPARRFELAFMILLSCVLVSAFIWSKIPPRENALDRFWSPLQNGSAPVLLCISDTSAAVAPMLNPPAPDTLTTEVAALPEWYRHNHVGFGDTLALTTLAGLLASRGQTFRVRRAESAELRDLQEGPVILIGGRSNPWSVQLGDGLRYGFLRDGNARYITDNRNPSSRQWGVEGLPHDPSANIKEDYALITRELDSATGHPLITAAGILAYGTEAASQCLADVDCLAQAESLGPADWKHKNIQIVLSTSIIGDDPGKPKVLAAYNW